MRLSHLVILTTASLLVLSACTEPQSTQDQTDASSREAPEPKVSDQPLSCNWPVAKGDTAQTLLDTFGERAVAGPLSQPDGSVVDGVILFRDDPAERIEVTFRDKDLTKVAQVRLGEAATAWRGPGGVHYGSLLSEVQAANGPFTLSSFRYDWGGKVTDWRKGTLATLPGGCRLSVAFGLTEGDYKAFGNPPEEEFASNDEALSGLKPQVTAMAVEWPKPGLFAKDEAE